MITLFSHVNIDFPLIISRYFLRVLGRGFITKVWDIYLYQSRNLKTIHDKMDLFRYLLTTKEGYESIINSSLDLTILRIIINDTYITLFQPKFYSLFKNKKFNQLKYFISGVILGTLNHPLNVIKNNHLIQRNIINPKNGSHVYKNRKDMIKRNYQKEGFYNAFFSGLPLAMLSIGIGNVVIMNLRNKLGKKKRKLITQSFFIPNFIFLINLTWNIPIEDAKVLMSIEPSKLKKDYNNSFECLLNVFQNKKILYKAYKKWHILYSSAVSSNLYNYLILKMFKTFEKSKI